MAEYRYISTDLMSGAVKGDWLPITPQNFARNINGTATFTGALNLTAGSLAERAAWVNAIEPRRTVLWVLLDGVPVWNGILWDWQPSSILDGTMPWTASTMDSLFAHRVISDDLTFTGMDVFDVFRGLASYAMGKTPNGNVHGITLGSSQAGISVTLTYTGTDMQYVSDAWAALITNYGFEYAFRPGLDLNGNLTTFLDLGYPELGQQFPHSALAYSRPGNLIDYVWNRTGSSSANKIIATGADTSSTGTGSAWTSQYPAGYDLTDLGHGYPLLEASVALTTVDVTTQGQIDGYATGVLPSLTGTQLTPVLYLGNEQGPGVSQITLGSWAQIALTSPLHPAGPQGQPGYQGQGRVTGFTLYPPTDSQAEVTWLQLYIPVT